MAYTIGQKRRIELKMGGLFLHDYRIGYKAAGISLLARAFSEIPSDFTRTALFIFYMDFNGKVGK